MTIPPDGTLYALDHLTRLQLHPGDILVCTIPHRLSDQERDDICEQLAMISPETPTLLLDGGATLAALRPTPEPS